MLANVTDHLSNDYFAAELDEWLPAPEAYRRIVTATLSRDTNLAIAQRAHVGLIRAKALNLTIGRNNQRDAEIPRDFWWAGGHEALDQDWDTGDFETWIDHKVHIRALGVSFHLGDLQKAFPNVFGASAAASPSPESPTEKRGRLPAEWWDDMWVEICRALYAGDLQPKKQSDLESAMHNWIAKSGNSAATSTVRGRARKLWQAIRKKDEY